MDGVSSVYTVCGIVSPLGNSDTGLGIENGSSKRNATKLHSRQVIHRGARLSNRRTRQTAPIIHDAEILIFSIVMKKEVISLATPFDDRADLLYFVR